MNEPSSRLGQIATFARTHLEQTAAQYPDPRHDAVYRWQHTLRVAQYGSRIAAAEGANVELVAAACLLHDVAHFEPGVYRDHGRVGAELSRPLLHSLGYTPDEVETICYSVAAHVDVHNPVTLEARIVSDADNIDRFGAYRALQWSAPDMHDYEKMIQVLKDRLKRLEGYRQDGNVLETPEGNRLFNQQLDLQILFFRALVQESELTIPPAS